VGYLKKAKDYRGREFMKYIDKCLDKLSGVLKFASEFIIFAVSTIVVINIIFRMLFKTPLLGTAEAVQYFVLIAISFALPKCTIDDDHTRVTFLIDMLPISVKKLSLIIMDLVSIGLLSLIAWNFWPQVISYFYGTRTTDILKIPYYLILAVIFISIILMALGIILRVITKVIGKGRNSGNQTAK
jgi:TRAP-type C4-dicarboxylate transport system permease small subunit